MGRARNSFGEKKCVQYFGGRSEGLIFGDNINMDLKEIGQGSVDCILLVQNKDKWQIPVSTAENILAPFNADNFLST